LRLRVHDLSSLAYQVVGSLGLGLSIDAVKPYLPLGWFLTKRGQAQ
jgi:hypothetical protein